MDLRGALGTAVIAIAACAESRPIAREPTQAEWTRALALLDVLRARTPDEPYVEHVRVTIHEPRSKKIFEARGAVAVQPGRAMRMVLIGPAGATALDAWTTRDRWRLDVPALGPPRRGDASPASLPIGFFRWWFLEPFEGRLLTVQNDVLTMRDGDATITAKISLAMHSCRMTLERRTGAHRELLEWAGLAFHPASGDRARYVSEDGLAVDVVVEGVSFGMDSVDAFQDPDTPSGVSL